MLTALRRETISLNLMMIESAPTSKRCDLTLYSKAVISGFGLPGKFY